MAPRLRTRSELAHRLTLSGLIALALLALGEAAPGAFGVAVSIEGHDAALQVTVDGQTHTVSSALGGSWRGVALEQPGPLEREYQIDGSDTTATGDRQPNLIQSLLQSPLYRWDAWLRDESSYSRWERLSIVDLATGERVADGAPLPPDFRIDATLRRPEASAKLWLLGGTTGGREGLELDRDRRNARWLIQREGGNDALPRWFFPEQPAPFAAELVHLLGRSAAAAYALGVAALALAWLTSRAASFAKTMTGIEFRNGDLADPDRGAESGLATKIARRSRLTLVGDVTLAAWLVAAALVSTRLYHQLPHILDGVSYSFQAGLFASGQLALPAPPVPEAFKGPFEVLWQGRIFSQYPPGAALFYALGSRVSLEWLVGPVACLVLIAATAWTARSLFGTGCGVVVLALGVLSPFVLFQAGSFFSHPISGALLAGALAAFVAAEERGRSPWLYAVTGALLGATFLAREVASGLFALPLGVLLIARRRWYPLAVIALFGAPFVCGYLLYNLRQTGSAFMLPRAIFNPADHFGFGDGVGFHTRHTIAAGLANTDELLTVLQFDLFGWPPPFVFGLMLVPFLFDRWRTWDVIAACGFLAFVVAYVGYFYHGVALGPRYYFEAVPWLLLLAGRGAQTLSSLARSRAAPALILMLLSLNTLLFYTPAELLRRTDLSGMPGGPRISLGFVQPSLLGPRLSGVPSPSLVLTDDWWVYNTALSALNCPRLPECGVLFALATTPEDAERLRAAYPDRTLLRAVNNAGRIDVVGFGN